MLSSSLPSYTHSQFREVYRLIPPIVLMSPEDAETLKIENCGGDILYNEVGRMKVRVVISDEIPRGVLWSPKQLIGLDKEPETA